jgi:tRNA 2-selenouridine synthase
MNKIIDIKTLMNNINKYILVDLRSPIEFEEDTIIGAVNIPLLDNEERKMIGTLYNDNQKETYKDGLRIASQKLPHILDKVNELKINNPKKDIVFFCFKGGLRSTSIQTVFELIKFPTYKLDKGYKSYRKYILDNLPIYLDKINWHVLTGNTGSGKTLILNELLKQGYPVIDLEALANNRGSIFGSIGLGNKVTQKSFESKLFFELKKYIDNDIKDIFVESESKKIGNITIPAEMFNKMQISSHILLNVSIDKRIEIINDIYNPSNIDKEYIKKLIINNDYFKQKLGIKWMDTMLEHIDKEEYNLFIKRMLLDYYDKLYGESHNKYQYHLIIDNDNIKDIVNKLIEYYNNIK